MDTRLRQAIVAATLLASTSGFAYGQAATDPAPSAAAAPNGDGGPQEIVVTAQRRSQSVLQVPLAISALSGEALAEKGITSSVDLGNAVPNLQINSAFGATQPNFSLRGISVANEYNANQVSPVGVYIDDVYIAARTSHGMGLFDLDRVEVLRGPQGTLFGRNTTGGAINFITKAPSLTGTNGYAEVGYGNYNDVRVQAAFETTPVEDKFGIRVAVNFERNDGLLKNVYPGGRDANSTDTHQGRIALRFTPTDDLDVKVRIYGGQDDGTQAGVHGLAAARVGVDFFDVNENRIGDNKTDSWGGAVTATYSLTPSVKLISITSYDGGGQNLGQDADGSPLDILTINWRSRFRQFSEEARVNYEGDALKLVGGLFYGWDQTVTNNTFDIGGALGPGVDGGFFQHYRQERASYAAFAQGDINLTENLVLTLGTRFTIDTAHYRDGFADLFFGGVDAVPAPLATTVPCAGPPGTCAYNPAARFDINGHNNAPTGRVALAYTLDNGMLAYASYSRGYRAGAFNGGGYTSSAGISYISPEEVNAYEVGLKGRLLDRKLVLSMAGFYYDYANQQVQDTRPGPVSFLVNAPSSEVYGGELEATYTPRSDLTLHGAFGYLHAEYDTLTLQGTNLSGNSLPFAPHITLEAGLDWQLFASSNDDVTFSPSLVYYSRQYFSPFDAVNAPGTAQVNSELQQGAYAKVNAALTWNHDDLTVRAWVNNLFDEKTYEYGLDLRGAGFPFNFLVPSVPRTFGVSAKYRF